MYHHGHTDAFYVLEGELTFEVGREREELSVSAGAGITRANLHGSGVDPGFIDDAPEAHDVAVDPNHVYWTGANSIGRANRDGTDVNQSLLAVPGSPSSIAVDATSKPVPPDSTPPADITAPQTKITKGARTKTVQAKARFKFSSDDPGATFECKLDKKSFRACTSPKTVMHLDGGKHKFQVRAVDAAGNRDPTPAKDTFKVPG